IRRRHPSWSRGFRPATPGRSLMRLVPFRLPAALAIAMVLAGCGLSDPYANQRAMSTTTSTRTAGTSTSTRGLARNADPPPERDGTIPAAAQASENALPAGAGSATPQGALERYANLYINWTATSVGRVQDELAAISVGQARAEALQAAAAYGHDSTLQQSQV